MGFILLIAIAAVLALLILLARPIARSQAADPGCRPYPVTEHSPTGVVGCVVYGDGIASRWPGPGVARNDCEYPWSACQTIRITSHLTGLSIVVTPRMYCGCWRGLAPGETGPTGELSKIVDLDPAAVRALGLDWDAGTYDVHVAPVDPRTGLPEQMLLPNTAVGG